MTSTPSRGGLLPFKAKIDELSAKAPGSSDATPAPAKKPCAAYEKQINSMEGDAGLVKDSSDLKLVTRQITMFSILSKLQIINADPNQVPNQTSSRRISMSTYALSALTRAMRMVSTQLLWC